MTLKPFFPKTIKKIINNMNKKPLIFDESGTPIIVCSSPKVHKIRNRVCVWCKKSVDQIHNQDQGSITSDSSKMSSFDLDSPTTLTVNPAKNLEVKEVILEVKEGLKPESMDLNGVKAYCTKCRIKTSVKSPRFEVGETRRGQTRYLKGSCSICGVKVCAIVKKEV